MGIIVVKSYFFKFSELYNSLLLIIFCFTEACKVSLYRSLRVLNNGYNLIDVFLCNYKQHFFKSLA